MFWSLSVGFFWKKKKNGLTKYCSCIKVILCQGKRRQVWILRVKWQFIKTDKFIKLTRWKWRSNYFSSSESSREIPTSASHAHGIHLLCIPSLTMIMVAWHCNGRSSKLTNIIKLTPRNEEFPEAHLLHVIHPAFFLWWWSWYWSSLMFVFI